MFGSFGALLTTGYVSYAYTLGEVETMTYDFRKSAYFAHPNPFFSWIRDSSPSIAMALSESFRESVKRDEDAIIPSILGCGRFFISSVVGVAALATNTYVAVRRLIEDCVMDTPMEPLPDKLLPDMDSDLHKLCVYTLVLDLNETLVHSDWLREYIEGGESFIRPGLDDFLERVSEMGYEVVLYTDVPRGLIGCFRRRLKNGGKLSYVLTKGSNNCQDGKCYRDLSKLNRDSSKILYLSAHAFENCLQPENCVPIKPWVNEVGDTNLTDLLPFLEYIAYNRPNDIRPLLSSYKGKDIATEFIERSKYLQRRNFGNGGRWGRF